jgi:hypothetical protein
MGLKLQAKSKFQSGCRRLADEKSRSSALIRQPSFKLHSMSDLP